MEIFNNIYIFCNYKKYINKFNLLPVLVPLIGPYRLIPFIGKTLTKRKPKRGPHWKGDSYLVLERQ